MAARHFVEVSVSLADQPGTTLTREIASASLLESQRIAEQEAVRLFPDDIDALSTFNNGSFIFWSVTDMGDEIFIRPMIEIEA